MHGMHGMHGMHAMHAMHQARQARLGIDGANAPFDAAWRIEGTRVPGTVSMDAPGCAA
jgi:hypothetical protein